MRSILITLTALLVTVLAHDAQAQDATPASAGLKVLERFVGTWDMVVTSEPTDGEATTGKTSETRKWSIGGKFVHFENPQTANPELREFHMLLTYDPAAKNYPGVLISGSFRTLITGTWDQKAQSMKFVATFPDGNKLNAEHKFIDKNHAESNSVTTSPMGKVLTVQTWKQTRR